MKRLIFTLVSLFVLTSSVVLAGRRVEVNPDAVDPQAFQAVKTTVDAHGATLATVQNQVNEVVTRFQTMGGDIARIDKKNKDQDKLHDESLARLQALEDKFTLVMTQLNELKQMGLVAPAGADKIKQLTDYSKGVEYINAKQYGKAVEELKNFQTTYKKSPYLSNAQFWIAESYYLQADYPTAIQQYQQVIKQDEKSIKAPTAVYRQGMAFFNMQQFSDAKVFFGKVIHNYPASLEAAQANTQIARINNIEELRQQQKLEMDMAQSPQ